MQFNSSDCFKTSKLDQIEFKNEVFDLGLMNDSTQAYNSLKNYSMELSENESEPHFDLLNRFEVSIRLNKNYVIDLFNEFTLDKDEFYQWKNALNESKIRVWFSQNGSTYSSSIPFVKCEMIFDFSTAWRKIVVDRYVLKFIMDALHSPERRSHWDTGIEENIALEEFSGNKHLKCYYRRNKVQPGQKSKYFLEKKLIFSIKQNSRKGEIPMFYAYVSDIPYNQRYKIERGENQIQANTIIGLSKVERYAENKVKLTIFSQTDMKLEMAVAMNQKLLRILPMDYQELAIASLYECESICQLLLEVEEAKLQQNTEQNQNDDIHRYNDLLKKMENENEFQQKLIEKLSHQIELLKQIGLGQGVKQVPGQKLNQRLLTNSQIPPKQNQNPQKIQELSQLDREVQLLKIQYSQQKKRSISNSQDRKGLNTSKSTERANHQRVFSGQGLDLQTLNELTKQELITYIQEQIPIKQQNEQNMSFSFRNKNHNFRESQSQRSSSIPSNVLLTSMSQTSIHTNHRQYMKQITALQTEIKELEKRHLIIVKDFNKLQDERIHLLQEKDSISLRSQQMERKLNDITQSMINILEEQQKQEYQSDIQEKINELTKLNKQKNQIIQEKDLEIAEKEREISDLRRTLRNYKDQEDQIQTMQQEINRLQTFENEGMQGLVFDYGLLPKSPKQNITQKQNKQVQCGSEEEAIQSDNKFLIEKYDSLKSQYEELQKEYQSQNTKQEIVGFDVLAKGIQQLKQTVIKYYLGKDTIDQSVQSAYIDADFQDIGFFSKIVKQLNDIIISQSENKNLKLKDNSERNAIYQSVDQLQKQFAQSLQSSVQSQGPSLSAQRYFNDLLVQFYKLKNSMDFFDLKYGLLKQKNKLITENYDKLCNQSGENNQLIETNKYYMSQILKLKKQLALQSTNETQKENGQMLKSPDRLSTTVNIARAVSPLRDSVQFSNRKENLTKSPTHSVQGENNKIQYLNTKIKELERKSEQWSQDNKEKDFLNNQMKEELNRKNQKIVTMEQLMEDMNKKINEQLKYIEILEQSQKQNEKQFLVQSQQTLRQHEDLMKSLTWKENELRELRQRSLQAESSHKETEQLQINLQVLRNQYDREKKLVEEKVRQLTELQSTTVQEKQLIKENQELRNMNIQLNHVIKEERLINEDMKVKMNDQLTKLREKIINIENGCARDIVLRLKNLKQDVIFKVEGPKSMQQSSLESQSVEQIINDINNKVNSIVKQRENLQKAVNVLQMEKQQLFQTKSVSGFTQRSFTGVSGGIQRSMHYKVDSSIPLPISTHSPEKLHRMASYNTIQPNAVSTIITNQQTQEDPNLIEYLQAEVAAARESKDRLSQKIKDLTQQISWYEQRLHSIDIFQKKENLDFYQQILEYVKEILSDHNQQGLLEDIISQPLRTKQNQTHVTMDESAVIYQENSAKLMQDLENLLPLISKCMHLSLLDKEKLNTFLLEREKENMQLVKQRENDMEKIVQRDKDEKAYIRKLEENYKHELQYLKAEKDVIVNKSKEFGKNLQILQQDNDQKKQTIIELRSELKQLKENTETLQKQLQEKYEKEYEQKMIFGKDEAYCRGRKEATDELVTENRKLRDLIDGLRVDINTKSKRCIELQFECEELLKYKKKSVIEIEELYVKLGKEREGQRELQQRLEQLLSEVSYLKNISRHMNQ